MVYQCEECGASFIKLGQLKQHRRTSNHWKKYICESCKKVFHRKDNLERHMKKHEDENNHHCPECLKVFTREDALETHIRQEHDQIGRGKKRPAEHQNDQYSRKRQKIQNSPGDLYRIEKLHKKNIEKFKTSATYYKIYFNDLEETGLADILKTLKRIFESLLQNITQDMEANDLIRLSMDNPQLDFPIVLPFMKKSALTVDRLLSEIERVLQSYEQFVLDETLGLELVHVHMPHGSSNKRKPFVDLSKLLKNKGSVIQIRNSDDLCCARAIVTAIARIENDPRWNSIRQGRDIQRQLAVELHKKASVPQQRCGLDEVQQFQKVLPNYQIHVLSKEHFNGIIYEGPDGGVPIYLYYHGEHFDVITKMTGFLNRSYYCQQCKKGYDHKERHACNNPCVYCHLLHEDTSENWLYCADCHRHFINDTCFKVHKQCSSVGRSTCQTYFKCKTCDQTVNMKKHKKPHACNETYCKTCKDFF